MLPDFYLDKDKMDTLFSELGKEYRKLSKYPAQIIVVGGAAIFTKYSFRKLSLDIDGMLLPYRSDALKHAINKVANNNNIPRGWLNDDFVQTDSYSDRIALYSDFYKTYSNVLEVRIVDSVHLIAMKLMSLRPYKFDLSDIYGILIEEYKNDNRISKDQILIAVRDLYGDKKISSDALSLLDDLFNDFKNIESNLNKIRQLETQNRSVLLNAISEKPEDNKQDVINQAISRLKK